MAYTRHGHHIPNTVELDLPPGKDCGESNYASSVRTMLVK